MLTLQECRMILGPEYTKNDGELETLRNDLYALAEMATNNFVEKTKGDKTE